MNRSQAKPRRENAPRRYVNELTFDLETVSGPETPRALCLKRSGRTGSETTHICRRAQGWPCASWGCNRCFLLAIAEPLVRLADHASQIPPGPQTIVRWAPDFGYVVILPAIVVNRSDPQLAPLSRPMAPLRGGPARRSNEPTKPSRAFQAGKATGMPSNATSIPGGKLLDSLA